MEQYKQYLKFSQKCNLWILDTQNSSSSSTITEQYKQYL